MSHQIPSLRTFLPNGDTLNGALDVLATCHGNYAGRPGCENCQERVRVLRTAVEAGNALRMAVGEAILVTTADEVRMPRADWDRIVDAAIAQRRAVDSRAVDDGE